MRNGRSVTALIGLILLFAISCGKSEKSSAERDAEVQKALQEGAAKEQKMYEGMQKGMEGVTGMKSMEKSAQEQKK